MAEKISMTRCSNCSSSNFKSLYTNQDYLTAEVFEIEACVLCGLVRTAGDIDDLSVYYPDAYYGNNGQRFVGLVETFVRWSRYMRASFIESKMAHKGAVLDVGCGRGILLKILQDRGWIVAGTEYDQALATHVQSKYGIHVTVVGELQKDLFPEKSVDVITMFHVLEHVKNPVTFIADMYRILKQGGVAIVEVPNFASLQGLIGRGRSFHLDAPRHRYHFSQQVLCRLFEQEGFVLESVYTHSVEYGYFGMAQTLLNKVTSRMNVMYTLLKNKGAVPDKRMDQDSLLSCILFAPVLLAAVPLEVAAAWFGKGGVLRVVARRK